jgi:hypothetical protein
MTADPSQPGAHALPVPSLVDLSAHWRSARVFHDSCVSEMDLVDRLSQWTEWVDSLLARRFATSLLLVGLVAGLIALAF